MGDYLLHSSILLYNSLHTSVLYLDESNRLLLNQLAQNISGYSYKTQDRYKNVSHQN